MMTSAWNFQICSVSSLTSLLSPLIFLVTTIRNVSYLFVDLSMTKSTQVEIVNALDCERTSLKSSNVCPEKKQILCSSDTLCLKAINAQKSFKHTLQVPTRLH